mmetsp:Transcript_47515/g.91887  ORF Transcript_47515/g.91887 Transcript_47515/m.91887 type:complete len:490 (-) Transcript_47515:191-1660(-)
MVKNSKVSRRAATSSNRELPKQPACVAVWWHPNLAHFWLQHCNLLRWGVCALVAAVVVASCLPSHRSSLFADVDAKVWRGEANPLPPKAARSDRPGTIQHFYFETRRTSEVHSHGQRWSFEEMEGRVADRFADSSVTRISPFVTRDVAEQLLDFSQKLLYEEGPDTVDQRPTFEAPLLRDGILLSPLRRMQSLSEAIENIGLPYVRERFNCSMCVACTAIIRRYLQGERREHPWHYDSDAYVTMVIPLTAAADYSGGLYAQPTFDRNDREFIELEAGDAVLHSFDVMHGVEVLSGERVSLIIWFKSNADACEKRLSPWYAEGAERGNPTAQYNLGRVVTNGLGGTPQDRPAGVEWYAKAAKQGHVMAMYNLAVSFHHGRGVPSDKEAALMWYSQAAHAGHPQAMTNYGYMQLFGLGLRDKNFSGAAFWFQKAALQEVDVAMFQLSHLLAKGSGIDANLSAAKHWLEQAASRGHQDSKLALRRLSATGSL